MNNSEAASGLTGNLNLISNDEEILAQYLKETNLEKVNRAATPVYPKETIYTRYIKRLLDLAIAIPVFAVALPFNLIFGICTFFDVGHPVFYKQARSGKDGKPFILVKFRNMNEKKDKDGRLLPTAQRVTKFGRIMRKFSLDELLNFWSVLKGDMSIIGPRPLPITFVERMSERHKKRNAVRPGLECPRIIKGDSKQCQYQNQFENDIWYVENVSFHNDLKMLIMLFSMTFELKKRDRAAEGAGYFAGYDENGVATTLNRFKRMYPETWIKVIEGSN